MNNRQFDPPKDMVLYLGVAVSFKTISKLLPASSTVWGWMLATANDL